MISTCDVWWTIGTCWVQEMSWNEGYVLAHAKWNGAEWWTCHINCYTCQIVLNLAYPPREEWEIRVTQNNVPQKGIVSTIHMRWISAMCHKGKRTARMFPHWTEHSQQKVPSSNLTSQGQQITEERHSRNNMKEKSGWLVPRLAVLWVELTI